MPNSTIQFDQVLSRNRGRLAGIAHAYADADADDLLQEILLQIWRGLRSFEGRSSVDTWCYRVALNTAMSWRRTAGRRARQLPSEAAELSEVSGDSGGHDAVDMLRRFLHTLGDSDRAVLLLYLDDLTGRQISEIIGVSENAVRVRIHRIKKQLSEWSVNDT